VSSVAVEDTAEAFRFPGAAGGEGGGGGGGARVITSAELEYADEPLPLNA
jgi:hypothetical protein